MAIASRPPMATSATFRRFAPRGVLPLYAIEMTRGRLEAFSDGVLAIIITIMVLELKVPHGDDLAALAADRSRSFSATS